MSGFGSGPSGSCGLNFKHIFDEINAMTSMSKTSFSVALSPENKAKNRYINILPNDTHRIKLTNQGYINASLVKMGSYVKDTILTQGPTDLTIDDFNEMLFLHGVTDIIMLCNFFEENKPKCAIYFAEKPNTKMETKKYAIRCIEKQNHSEYESRLLSIQKLDSKNANDHFHVYHYWMNTWPDFGVIGALKILPLIEHFLPYFEQDSDYKIAIHCSAGVGRSGTIFIGIAMILYQTKVGPIDLETFKNMFIQLRDHRPSSIQTSDQLALAYDIWYEYCKKYSLINLSKNVSNVANIIKEDNFVSENESEFNTKDIVIFDDDDSL